MNQPDGSGAPTGGSVLKSNVDAVQPEPASRERGPRRFPLAMVLGGVVLLVSGVAAGLLLASSTQSRPTAPSQTPRAAASTVTSAATAPDINGISCDALEATIVHIHVHLAVFLNGEEQEIPFGVGIGEPWQVAATSRGPFVTNGSCFYWLHTHTGDGVVHIESPVRRRFTLGDFFAVWQVPLSTTQVGNAQGPLITYVNGQLASTNPPDIPLLPHERIQLDVGTDVPPRPFEFAPGD
jgi:hypothetical protein